MGKFQRVQFLTWHIHMRKIPPFLPVNWLTANKLRLIEFLVASVCSHVFITPLLSILKVSSEYKKKSLIKKRFFSQLALVIHCLLLTPLLLMGFVRSSVLHSTRQKCDQVINNFFRSFLQNFDSQNISSSSSESFSTQRLRGVLFRLLFFFFFMIHGGGD